MPTNQQLAELNAELQRLREEKREQALRYVSLFGQLQEAHDQIAQLEHMKQHYQDAWSGVCNENQMLLNKLALSQPPHPQPQARPTMSADDIHSCSPFCTRPGCVADREANKPEPQAQAGGEAELHEKVKWGAQTYGPLLRAAIDLLASVDARHEETGTLKYTIPYGAVNALRDALTAHPQPQAVAQGWRLVPVEPTRAMDEAGYATLPQRQRHLGYDLFRVYYRAMLSASPAAPAEQNK